MMAPLFAAAAAQLPAVRFAKVDTEAAPSLGARYRVQSIPTLILFHKGAEVARRSGAIAAPELLRWIQSQV
jgi:thioredoxin 2